MTPPGSVSGTPAYVAPLAAVAPVRPAAQPAGLPDAPSAVTEYDGPPEPEAVAFPFAPSIEEAARATPAIPMGRAQAELTFVDPVAAADDDFWQRSGNGAMSEAEFVKGVRTRVEDTLGPGPARVLMAGAGLAYVSTGGEVSYNVDISKVIPRSKISFSGSIEGKAGITLKLLGDR